MASEEVLKKLFETSRLATRVFRGLSEKDIWEACLVYKDQADAAVMKGIENIQKEEQRLKEEEDSRKNSLTVAHEKIMQLRAEAEEDEKKEGERAEKLIGELLMKVPRKSLFWRIIDFLFKPIKFN